MIGAYELCRQFAIALRRKYYAVKMLGDVEDVTQIGARGLLAAAAKFDRSLGKPFAVYAEARIRGSILDAARNGSFIRVPRVVQQRGGRPLQVVSLDSLKNDRDGERRSGWEPSRPERRTPAAAAAVEQFLATLTPREASIVRMRFGLDGGEKTTIREVGWRHSISEGRACQILQAALSRGAESAALRELHRPAASEQEAH